MASETFPPLDYEVRRLKPQDGEHIIRDFAVVLAASAQAENVPGTYEAQALEAKVRATLENPHNNHQYHAVRYQGALAVAISSGDLLADDHASHLKGKANSLLRRIGLAPDAHQRDKRGKPITTIFEMAVDPNFSKQRRIQLGALGYWSVLTSAAREDPQTTVQFTVYNNLETTERTLVEGLNLPQVEPMGLAKNMSAYRTFAGTALEAVTALLHKEAL